MVRLQSKHLNPLYYIDVVKDGITRTIKLSFTNNSCQVQNEDFELLRKSDHFRTLFGREIHLAGTVAAPIVPKITVLRDGKSRADLVSAPEDYQPPELPTRDIKTEDRPDVPVEEINAAAVPSEPPAGPPLPVLTPAQKAAITRARKKADKAAVHA